MIEWLSDVIGYIPIEYEYIYYIVASVLVVILITNVINLFFNPFRVFK